MSQLLDKRTKRIGFKFNRLTVVDYAGSKNGKAVWKCLCECGNFSFVQTPHFQKTVSCGCYLREVRAARAARIGQRKRNPLYGMWKNIRGRCNNPNNQDFKHYGGRGITLWPGWDDFLRFAEYINTVLGPKPSQRHSIDRVETNGNYEPGNVRWATQQDQCNNKRTNHTVTCGGETLTVMQWARKLSIPPTRIYTRLNRGDEGCRAVRHD